MTARELDLSPTMERGLELALEQGRLERQTGGFWTPPGEPMRGHGLGPRNGDRGVGTQTVRALERRGLLVDGDEWGQREVAHDAIPFPHSGGCPTCRSERRCSQCGGTFNRGDLCTNGRCLTCCRDECTPGGVTGPGHGYGRPS